MEERAESALTGYLLLDLWHLLASRKEQKQGTKKGTFCMAKQTKEALQNVAASIAVMTTSKPEGWNPWHRAQTLSEVHIERFFGRLRRFSESGDMTVRTYWSHSASVARSQLFRMKNSQQSQVVDNTPALSEEKLLVNACHLSVFNSLCF